MSDYGTMISRIEDETLRSDLNAQVKLCIQEAIAHYEVERFWFNQSRTETFATVASQEYYDSADNSDIPYILGIDSLNITVNGARYALEGVPWDHMEAIAISTSSTGRPFYYCYWGQKIRLYPIPNDAWTVTIAGLFKLSTLSANSDTNAWMVEGERLIRNRATAVLYEQYLRNDVAAMRCTRREREEYDRLKASTSRRNATGNIQPSL